MSSGLLAACTTLAAVDSSGSASTAEKLVLAAINSEEGKLSLMSSRDGEAMTAMLYMQEMIDQITQINSEQRHIARRLLVKLSRNSGILPSCLFLNDVVRRSEDSVAGGSFADIFLAEYHGQVVALKRLRVFQANMKQKAAQFDALCREALVWRQLKHPNILPFLGIDVKTFETVHFHCMVSPWMKNGSILQCMEKMGEDLDQMIIDKWVCETIEGLRYLHSERVVHGDLRGANILVDEHLSVQLSDFGLAKFADASTASWGTHSGGGIRWMAPEVLKGERASFKSDIYSFGCVCIEIYTQKPPFSGVANDAQVVAHVLRGAGPDMYLLNTPLNATNVWSQIKSCWLGDAAARPDSESLARNLFGRSTHASGSHAQPVLSALSLSSGISPSGSSPPSEALRLKLEADALRREVNEWRDRSGLPRVEEPVRGDAFCILPAALQDAAIPFAHNVSPSSSSGPAGNHLHLQTIQPRPRGYDAPSPLIVQSPMNVSLKKPAKAAAASMYEQQGMQHSNQHYQAPHANKAGAWNNHVYDSLGPGQTVSSKQVRSRHNIHPGPFLENRTFVSSPSKDCNSAASTETLSSSVQMIPPATVRDVGVRLGTAAHRSSSGGVKRTRGREGPTNDRSRKQARVAAVTTETLMIEGHRALMDDGWLHFLHESLKPTKG